ALRLGGLYLHACWSLCCAWEVYTVALCILESVLCLGGLATCMLESMESMSFTVFSVLWGGFHASSCAVHAWYCVFCIVGWFPCQLMCWSCLLLRVLHCEVVSMSAHVLCMPATACSALWGGFNASSCAVHACYCVFCIVGWF
ncbi:unnamed protein product, partial [Staurois parvus]